MSDPLDAFVDNLQQQIFYETREAFGEVGFDRWRNPKYNGAMENPDADARVTGSCGDTMQIFLKFDNGRVADASYVTDGCGSSSVCGSFAVEMAMGRNPDEVAQIDGEAVLTRLGRFPKEDEHCAFLAAETLQAALHDYMTKHKRASVKPIPF
jgi:nitrogen fixation protein NifU and related proteins